ncbi:MAG TPA: YdeI/OmpD-associated family protein [Candidatus Saccharimonadales bacterium]|nr:YdeI/OmpD-associated family protein [Candidatus Saccharimonadales bacterium]
MSDATTAGKHEHTEPAADIISVLQHAGLQQKFAALPPSHRREYIIWIEGAKKSETRAGRIQKMCTMLTEKP